MLCVFCHNKKEVTEWPPKPHRTGMPRVLLSLPQSRCHKWRSCCHICPPGPQALCRVHASRSLFSESCVSSPWPSCHAGAHRDILTGANVIFASSPFSPGRCTREWILISTSKTHLFRYSQCKSKPWIISKLIKHYNHLEGSLKQIPGSHPQSFRVRKPRVGPKDLSFKTIPSWCCWFKDYPLRTPGLSTVSKPFPHPAPSRYVDAAVWGLLGAAVWPTWGPLAAQTHLLSDWFGGGHLSDQLRWGSFFFFFL